MRKVARGRNPLRGRVRGGRPGRPHPCSINAHVALGKEGRKGAPYLGQEAGDLLGEGGGQLPDLSGRVVGRDRRPGGVRLSVLPVTAEQWEYEHQRKTEPDLPPPLPIRPSNWPQTTRRGGKGGSSSRYFV